MGAVIGRISPEGPFGSEYQILRHGESRREFRFSDFGAHGAFVSFPAGEIAKISHTQLLVLQKLLGEFVLRLV